MSQFDQRKVSRSAWIELLFGSKRVQLSLALIAMMVFSLKNDVLPWAIAKYYFNAYELSEASGKITDIKYIGHEHGPDTKELIFEFVDQFGDKIVNLSYSKDESLQIGQTVDIEYVLLNPTYSRIKRTFYIRVLPLFPILFIIAALFVIIKWRLLQPMRNGKQGYELLKSGYQGEALIVESKKSDLNLGHASDYEYTFECQPGNHIFNYSTLSPSLLSQGNKYTTFYDLQDPAKLVVFESLPGNLCIDSEGNIHSNDENASKRYLILPLVILLLLMFV